MATEAEAQKTEPDASMATPAEDDVVSRLEHVLGTLCDEPCPQCMEASMATQAKEHVVSRLARMLRRLDKDPCPPDVIKVMAQTTTHVSAGPRMHGQEELLQSFSVDTQERTLDDPGLYFDLVDTLAEGVALNLMYWWREEYAWRPRRMLVLVGARTDPENARMVRVDVSAFVSPVMPRTQSEEE